MNVPPSEAKQLSLYEYEALLWNWNEMHSPGDDAPDPETTMILIDRINADARLTGSAPETVN
jgi:hypothetical protein